MKPLTLLSTVLLISCAGAPPGNDALEQARAAYRAAQGDPDVTTYAAAELDAAGRTLEEAERAKRRDERVHRAYMAEQRARIARELAQARANDRRQLETRLSEVEQARDVSDRLSAQVRRLQAQVAELQAEDTDRGWILTLGSDVLFDVGKASIKPGGRRAIANLARVMRQEAERKIVIEGFTDDRGSAQANERLSARRAEAVRDALVRAGIDAGRIDARGLGAAYPVASNQDPGGRQLNRRVEILIGETAGRAATGASRAR